MIGIRNMEMPKSCESCRFRKLNPYIGAFYCSQLDAEHCIITGEQERLSNCPLTDNVLEIPEGSTNGDIVKAMFPNKELSVFGDGYGHKRISAKFTETEWDEPYKKGYDITMSESKKEYKISSMLTERQKNNVEVLLNYVTQFDADFRGIHFKLEEIQEREELPEEKGWPQDGDTYYFLVSEGLYDDACFRANERISEARLSIGNCFKTREETEFEVERLKVLAEMKKFAEPEDKEWGGENDHWYLYYNFDGNNIWYARTGITKFTDMYFESLEKAQECVQAVGEDRIKKYYLRIEE